MHMVYHVRMLPLVQSIRFDMRWHYLYAGTLIGVAFLHAWLWWLALIGLAVLYHTLMRAPTNREAIHGSMGAGVIKGLCATAWLLDSFPADWIGGVGRFEQLAFIAFCWVGSGVSTGIAYALLGTFAMRIARLRTLVRIGAFGLALVASDVCGAFLFSVYTLGATSGLSANFGFGMSGFLLAEHRFLQWFAVVGGVYVLSFIMGTIASTLSELHALRGGRISSLMLVIIVATSALPGPHAFTPHAHARVAAIGTDYSSYRTMTDAMVRERREDLASALRAALEDGAQIVALPEDARLGIGIDPRLAAESLSLIPHEPGALIIDSYRTESTGAGTTLRGYIYDLDHGRVYMEDKRFMVPVGEYMPWLHATLARMLGGASVFSGMTYEPGNASIPSDAPEHVPSMLFCFESGATPVLRDKMHTRPHTPLIVHPVSHAWFHNPHTLWNQERQMLIIQSIYAGTPILQAGNRAPSALYLPNGTVEYGTTIASGARWSTIVFE